ncbi:MAG TPA: HAD-IA family hydrolase [Devosia sp.]|nr:HAD-IA family hydrolase [Devosia sp.]
MRLIIFDMDGTLVDTVGLIVETVTDAFAAINEPVPSEAAIRSISGITAREAMGMLSPGATPERVDTITESYRKHYRERAGVSREPLFSGALEALDALRAQPDSILAIATGKGYRGAVTLLERHNIRERFHSVETPDHNRGKPDPQMIYTAMEKAGAKRTETVMIGDTVHDMRMAKAAGVKALGVAWGYHEVSDLREAGADLVVASFAELVPAIDKLLGGRHA